MTHTTKTAAWLTDRELAECGCDPCTVEQAVRADRRKERGWSIEAIKKRAAGVTAAAA